MKKHFRLLLICGILILPSCGSSSRVSVDPWPGLFKLKETNREGYKKSKKRDKKLKKLNKERHKNH